MIGQVSRGSLGRLTCEVGGGGGLGRSGMERGEGVGGWHSSADPGLAEARTLGVRGDSGDQDGVGEDEGGGGRPSEIRDWPRQDPAWGSRSGTGRDKTPPGGVDPGLAETRPRLGQ